VLPRRREFQSFPYTFEILLLIAGGYLAVMANASGSAARRSSILDHTPDLACSLFLSKAIFILVFFLSLPVFAGNLAATNRQWTFADRVPGTADREAGIPGRGF